MRRLRFLKEKNEKRIAEAKKSGTLPGFVRENGEYVKSKNYSTTQSILSTSNDETKQISVGSAAMPNGLASYEQKDWNDNEIHYVVWVSLLVIGVGRLMALLFQ